MHMSVVLKAHADDDKLTCDVGGHEENTYTQYTIYDTLFVTLFWTLRKIRH